MSHLAWRTQIAVLWMLQVINFVSIIFISYFETGLIADINPEASGVLLSVYFLVFAVLIWLAFSLRPKIGRWIHIVFGALTVLLKASYIVQALMGAYSMAFLLNETWGAVAAGILIWVAWRLPKPDAH
jgi:hypothetical protein